MQNLMSQATTETVSLQELDLEFQPSGSMHFQEPAVYNFDNKYLVVGYIVDDEDCENPLTSCDGMGSIHTRTRGSLKSSIKEMQTALALDSDFDPDLELVYDHPDVLMSIWLYQAMASTEFKAWVDRDIEEEGNSRVKREDRGEQFYRRRAYRYLKECSDSLNVIEEFEFSFVALKQAWKQLRNAGLIGNKYGVLLDCYEHSGQSWSVTGTGMQCRWDTSTGAGIWLPDDCAEEELQRRESVYAFGRIDSNGSWTSKSGKKRYWAITDVGYGSTRSENFEKWHEAFEWLASHIKNAGLKLPRAKEARRLQLLLASQRAADELARQALDTYNEWLSGACYGVVSTSFSNVGEAKSPIWQRQESDEVWGFIGSDYAMEEAESMAKSVADRYSRA